MAKQRELEELQDNVYLSDSVESNIQIESSTSSMVYRYFCPACTGTAFVCANKQYFEDECQLCHASLDRDENNYIQL